MQASSARDENNLKIKLHTHLNESPQIGNGMLQYRRKQMRAKNK